MEKRRKKVTMKDVADAAHVSVATVSHVINHSASISLATIERVQKIIETLGYKPLPQADLQLGNRTIAVFTPDISNEFYSCIVQAISDEAWKNNYAVTICNTCHHHKTEILNLRRLIRNGVQGLIFCGGSTDDEAQIINAAKCLPVVLCDRKIIGSQINSIGTNNIDVMKQMITRLARYGYTRIGYISEDPIMSNAYDRYLGFRLGMEENGLEIDNKWVILDPSLRLNKIENGNKIMRTILNKKVILPQILLCTSDLIAVGVIAGLREKGYCVPRDVGIVGFDDITLARFCSPPLTTIAQDMKQLGRSSVRSLLHKIETPEQAAEDIAIDAKIIVRKSAKL